MKPTTEALFKINRNEKRHSIHSLRIALFSLFFFSLGLKKKINPCDFVQLL